MFVYIFIILLLFLLSFIEIFVGNKRTKKYNLYLTYIILVVVVGFRWETGTDWGPYLDTFELVNSYPIGVLLASTELGYLFLNKLVRLFTDNYSIFLIVHAIIYYFLILKSIPKLVPYPQLAILLFFCSTMGMMGSNRQLLALGLCFLALTYLLQNKKWIFFVLVLVASLFHTTALLFLVFILFDHKFSIPVIVISVLVAIVIGYSHLPLKVFSLFGGLSDFTEAKTSFYLYSAEEELRNAELPISGLLKRIIFLVFFILVRDKALKKFPSYNLMLNGYIFGVIFYFLFSQSLLVMISRGSFYFNAMEPLLLSSLVIIMKGKSYKMTYFFVLLLLSFLLFFQSISTYPELFIPYKGLFINQDYTRIMY